MSDQPAAPQQPTSEPATREPHTHAKPPWWPEDEAWPSTGWGPPPFAGPRSRRERRRMRMAGAVASDAGTSRHDSWSGWPGYRRGLGCLVVLFATFVVSIGVLVLWVLSSLFGHG